MSDLLSSETRERRRGMLRTAMGPAIALALDEPDVVEVMVNPDGRLWLDRHGSGRSDTGVVLTPYEAERIILLVASHMRAEASGSSPVAPPNCRRRASVSRGCCRRWRWRRVLPFASRQRRRSVCQIMSRPR